jgi:hypothetical protein
MQTAGVRMTNQAIGKNIDTILKDIKKYTNIQPVIFISEIKQVR